MEWVRSRLSNGLRKDAGFWANPTSPPIKQCAFSRPEAAHDFRNAGNLHTATAGVWSEPLVLVRQPGDGCLRPKLGDRRHERRHSRTSRRVAEVDGLGGRRDRGSLFRGKRHGVSLEVAGVGLRPLSSRTGSWPSIGPPGSILLRSRQPGRSRTLQSRRRLLPGARPCLPWSAEARPFLAELPWRVLCSNRCRRRRLPRPGLVGRRIRRRSERTITVVFSPGSAVRVSAP